MKDINVEAMNDVHDMAKKDAEAKLQKMENEIGAIREESISLGVLQKINYDNAHNELLKYATLYQVRENKEYKNGGMTWEQFCEKIGEPKRTVNDKLKDIRPLVENFQASLAHFSKVPFNKIRYLGRSVRADSAQIDENALLIDGMKISLESDNKEDIEAAIDSLIETHKNEKKALKKDLKKYKKNTDQIIDEETKGLKVERDALIKEVERLKPFDVTEKDTTWSVEQIKKISQTADIFCATCGSFVLDDRIDTDIELQAEAEKYVTRAELAIQELRRTWIDRFSGDF